MMLKRSATLGGMTFAALLAAAGASSAQTASAPTPSVEQRLADQERRIGAGLKDGSLTAGEAARLQREESSLNREWARDKADGVITPQEQTRVSRDLNRVSRDIYTERHDAQRANPDNPINQRLGNQAERISQGIQDGSLTNREAARLERGQARIAQEEHKFRAGNDGKPTKGERAKFRKDLNRSSTRIYRERHDAQTR